LSIIAFNIASANVYVQRGLERSKAYAASIDRLQSEAHPTLKRVADKSSTSHNLSLTFNIVGINNASIVLQNIVEVSTVFNSIFKAFSLEDLLYPSFKPPKLNYFN